jgi:tetratricopeptide (TPR) repeat protein
MIKICALAAILAAGLGTARADDKPNDKPNENLQNGAADDRPWAKNVSQAEQDAALALFSEGNSQLNLGLLAQAADKYTEALKHWDHPAIHYNLALVLFKQEKPIEVVRHLEKAVAYGPAPLDPDKFTHAQELLQVESKRLAEIEVTCDKAGAEIMVDNKKVMDAPGTFKDKIVEGRHTFVCRKPGSITHIRTPAILGGEKFRVELKLHTPEELTRYKRRWDATWMPYAVLGGGALVAAIGGIFELSARSSFSDFDKQVASCDMNNAGCPTSNTSVANLRSSGNTKQSIAYVGYGLGSAGIVAGALLIYLNRSTAYHVNAEQLDDDNDKHDTPAPTGVSVAPVVTPTMAGAMVQGHF